MSASGGLRRKVHLGSSIVNLTFRQGPAEIAPLLLRTLEDPLEALEIAWAQAVGVGGCKEPAYRSPLPA